MLRFELFAVLFAAVCAVPIDDESKSSDVDVLFGGSFEEYLAQNPEMKLLRELDEVEIQCEGSNVTSTFTWGKRVAGK